MELHVFLAVLAAAAMHAGWNAFLKLRIEPFLAMTLVTAGAGAVGLPGLIAFGFPKLEAWPWLIASLVLHLGYYLALTQAYARADMSQMYPIARGGAPLITAFASLALIGESVSPVQALGIAALGCGVMLISLLGRRKGAHFDLGALGFAGLTALTISGYTLVDGIGARTAGDPHAYSAALFVIDGFPLLLFALWRRGAAGLAPMRPYLLQGLAGGAMSLGAYWIAIWAMTVAPIPLVAAVRESSVLFAALIATLLLKEPVQWARAGAAVVIVCALVLMRMG
ncbi:EamA family transporter [Chelatococcus sambhunathii]|uniref:EamA family transporter n=1 Tax=Chelatococcus sambhunathii TaxID=363953 RepID=A0ABU1DDA9_9HYPH|nr:EamA family transporter [Chelatococcus sambhunathii]MDR4306062.1 EamA family transporter [Chelatococcus sambhunathii]